MFERTVKHRSLVVVPDRSGDCRNVFHTVGSSALMSMMTNVIFIVAAVIYLLRTMIFWIGVRKERRKDLILSRTILSAYPRVSVIVPARNEEENIENCIHSLMRSSYPKDRFEVIVVNDRSTDATEEILRKLHHENSNLIIHNTTVSDEQNYLRGKTRALHQGINLAQGEIIMMTDADCVVSPDWITSAVKVFGDPDVGFVASFTLIDAQNIFEKMQALEWVFNHTLASAGVGLKQPLGCFGNNLSIRRKLYEQIGGYASIPFSVTEDLALLQTVAKTSWKIRYICNDGMKVHTIPAKDIGTFIHQHRRWAKGGQALGWRALIFVLSSAAIWLGVLTAIYTGAWGWLGVLLTIRILGDSLLILPSLRFLDVMQLYLWFPPAVLFFMLIELIIPFFLLKRSIIWKGQVFR